MGQGVLMAVLSMLLSGCFEGEEGCLDAKARNYDVTADTDCSGCCTYPTLGLNFTHKVYTANDTTNLAYQTPYSNNLGQYFMINSIRYYLSEVKLVDDSGNPIEVEDRIDIPFVQGSDTTYVETADNFALVKPDVFGTLTIGTLIYDGKAAALQFTVGIPEFIQGSAPELFDVDHPLAEQSPAMYDTIQRRYVYDRISVLADTLSETTAQVIQITEEDRLITVILPLDITVPSGYNMLVSLEVDYLSWFANIDFQNEDQHTYIDKIVANLPNSFQVLSVTFSR